MPGPEGGTAATPVGRSGRLVEFAPRLIDWQRTHGRQALPWQHTRDPYRVWLSEVMLQQTQVQTVLGYYERFLARFPDVGALAAATLDEVYALWSGLGYYSRARNLHACARRVVAEHGGRFPDSAAALAQLPGIGRSTAAAIAAFCHDERAAILDGNVKRVLTRVLAFDGDLAEARPERALWAEAEALLPEREVGRYTQALMDVGATICSVRAPACLLCPARELCAAAAAGTQERYPVRTRKLKRGARAHLWLWSTDPAGRVWLLQRPPTGVWAGLWSLPEFDTWPELDLATAGWPGAAEPLPSFTHVLTHLDWTLQPVRWRWSAPPGAAQHEAMRERWPTGRWFERAEALEAGLPSPLRKLLLSP